MARSEIGRRKLGREMSGCVLLGRCCICDDAGKIILDGSPLREGQEGRLFMGEQEVLFSGSMGVFISVLFGYISSS